MLDRKSDAMLQAVRQTVERVIPSIEQQGVIDQSSATTHFYIQAIQGNQGVFLCTNLPHNTAAHNTAAGIAWLIGRSPHCAIVLPDPSISRCHVLIGYDVQQGFYILDVGSRNGTFLNQQRLSTMQRYSLNDGDRITLSQIQIQILLQPLASESGHKNLA